MSETTAPLPFVPGEKPGSTSAAPTSDAATALSVQRQIEYYFSEANLPKDKFLQAECAKTEEGWVDVSVIASFNRIKQLLPDEAGRNGAIADALRESKSLIVSDDGSKVRRPDGGKTVVTLGGVEFPTREEVISHARGLISSAGEGGKLSDDAQAFVRDIFAHHGSKTEKEGAGIASFKVGRNPAFPDTMCFVLVRVDETEADFSYLKCLDRIYGAPGGGRGAGNAKRKRGADDEPSSKRGKSEGEEGGSGEVQYEPGKIVVFKALPDGFDRHTLREKLGGVDKGCSFVEMVPEMPLAYARFATPDQATAALAVEGVGEPALLEGADEKQYWEKIASGGGGKGGGKGGKGKGRGGKGKGKGGRGKGGRGKRR